MKKENLVSFIFALFIVVLLILIFQDIFKLRNFEIYTNDIELLSVNFLIGFHLT